MSRLTRDSHPGKQLVESLQAKAACNHTVYMYSLY